MQRLTVTIALLLLLLLLSCPGAMRPPQPETLQRIAADPFTFAAPGGESQQELEARMCSFVHRQLLPGLQYAGPPAVVVTHGLAIKW
jgi:broad specificity phosphatase PhoE